MRTYGTLRLDGSTWVVECEPHVAIRLKRMFGAVGAKSHGAVRLADTDEVCNDLLWFMQRYPLEVRNRAHLERRASSHKERMSVVDAMLSRRVPPPAFELALPPREYQRVAAGLVLHGRSLLLADDVGLGKTVSSICLLSDQRAVPALVVTLTHLPRQWQAEIERFAPKLRTQILKKGTPYDLTERRSRGRQLRLPDAFPDVVICNYHKLAGWAETLAPLVKTVIFDEVQELRNADTKRYSAATHIARTAEYRLGLSATPIYNYGGEIFNVLDALQPGALGTRSEFVEEWCSAAYGDKPRIKEPKAFGSYLRETGLMLRRTRAEVGRELPALTKIPHHVDADERSLDKVGASAAELARIILAKNETKRGEKFTASEELSSVLRQATGIAKAPFVADFVRLLVESGEKVVLYGWHREVYSIWLDRLADIKPALYTGTESPSQKEESKRRFVEGETPVLIMSLRSGAGLDGLQGACRTVVFGELDWSPAVHEQGIGRVHRDGQPEPVVAYFMIADAGADPIIADVLGVKVGQIEGLRDPNAELVEVLDTGTGNIKRLAEAFLRQRGLPLPTDMEEAS